MPDRPLEIPTFEEIRRILGDDARTAPIDVPDPRPDDSGENDHD